jgi:hypothetical protein
VQVGILTGGARADSSMTNAEIGYEHEFGNPSNNLPERSFLRMPLIFNLRGNLNKDWSKTIQSYGFTTALKQLGVIAEGTIQKAFATGGFGFWEPLRPATIARKGSSAILIDTSQLRRSISSRVV